jgi:hypothetical protein
MSLDHIALTVGIIAFALIFISTYGSRTLKKRLSEQGQDKLNDVFRVLDKLRVLPWLWVVSTLGIGIWLVTRVVISYQ